MRIFIKYMVSIRCKMIVKAVLDSLSIVYYSIDLGEVEIGDYLSEEQRADLKTTLAHFGLELLDDKRAILVNRIKSVVIEMVHYADELPAVKNSVYISEKLHYDYTYLANLFSETTGMTIEHYIILQKIERVKELLLYDETSLTEISYKLRYSSVAHLSNQFKKVTGLTPTFFKKLRHKRTSGIEDV